MSNPAREMAEKITKEQLLKRMKSYVKSEAKRKKVPEWSIVGHIFAQGSGVSCCLWDYFIDSQEDEQKDG